MCRVFQWMATVIYEIMLIVSHTKLLKAIKKTPFSFSTQLTNSAFLHHIAYNFICICYLSAFLRSIGIKPLIITQ